MLKVGEGSGYDWATSDWNSYSVPLESLSYYGTTAWDRVSSYFLRCTRKISFLFMCIKICSPTLIKLEKSFPSALLHLCLTALSTFRCSEGPSMEQRACSAVNKWAYLRIRTSAVLEVSSKALCMLAAERRFLFPGHSLWSASISFLQCLFTFPKPEERFFLIQHEEE